ncbi:MAG: hypothetical protein D3903_05980 [Candidatus Electrothrix sp. GM3_4]|nr:hypothetical protein [Candidatus Electrothrix sp. GM3_4]
MEENPKYASGLGKESVVPPEIAKWNWGAFFLNWIWGIGNSTYIAFLMFVPFVGFIMPFILGAKGSEWAWQKKTWRDIDHFKQTQKKWAISGLVLCFIVFPLFIFITITTINGMIKSSEAFKISLATVQNNQEVIEAIGSPIESGFFVSGSFSTSGSSGEAELNYKIIGPNGEGITYVAAEKKIGEWNIFELVTYFEALDKRIDIISPQQQGAQ